MSALALILLDKGARILGSDRAYDQGLSLQKFKSLQEAGIELFPQDGSGFTEDVDALVVSSAVEESIPDVLAAKTRNIPIVKRAELLADVFNTFPDRISIAGTSGKSTVTGMIATILEKAGLDPTVMNGGVIRNLKSESNLGNMLSGKGGVFVTETDESDGSIALYKPSIAVLNNIALDHKDLKELKTLFGDFVARGEKAVILNFDDPDVSLLKNMASAPVMSYALENKDACLMTRNIKLNTDSVFFDLVETETGYSVPVSLNVPGEHNVSNALAAIAVSRVLEVPLGVAAASLQDFMGIGRRFETIGTKNGITVIDDFAHNPDKISATLKTLKDFEGRIIIVFQPHGFAPLKLMGKEMAETFATYLDENDFLLMPEAYYAGGTTDRSVSAKDVVAMVKEKGAQASWFEERAEIQAFLDGKLRPGDRVIVMGARDDTLSDFAKDILEQC